VRGWSRRNHEREGAKCWVLKSFLVSLSLREALYWQFWTRPLRIIFVHSKTKVSQNHLGTFLGGTLPSLGCDITKVLPMSGC
jgi:hypothetical protein